MEELLRCPFCGGDKVNIQINDRAPNLFPYAAHILCLNCLASVGTHGFEQTKNEAKAKAISAWNTRAQPEPRASVWCKDCRWYHDGVCCNADSDLCADYPSEYSSCKFCQPKGE